MRIVVIGAGRGGWHLSEVLCQHKHDVVVVDQDAQALAELEGQLDILTVRGNGSSPRVLAEAEVEKAQLLVATTDNDPVNILACHYAKQVGVPNRIARISNDEFLSPKSKLNLQETGVSLAVSKSGAIALELFNIISHPGTTQVVDLFNGRVQVIGFQVHMDSPLIRAPLQAVADQELLNKLRFVAVMRGDEMIVPRGDTRFLIGDIVYVASQPEHIQSLLKWASPEYSMFDKVVIAGGGSLGRNLARRLEDTSSKIVLIESDKQQATECSSVLERTLVLHGNALAEGILAGVGIVQRTAFVATTGSDENNMISCLLAEKLGANFTLAQINKREYLSIVNSQSLLDRAVSSYVAMTNEVLHYLRVRRIKSATVVRTLPGELLEVRLASNHKWVGRRIQELKMPKGTVIASTLRDGRVQVPTGPLQLSAGDYLLIFAQADSVRKLEALFRD